MTNFPEKLKIFKIFISLINISHAQLNVIAVTVDVRTAWAIFVKENLTKTTEGTVCLQS